MANADFRDFVVQTENTLLNAQVQRDRSALEEILSENYVGINPDGTRVSKTKEIENLLGTSYSSGEIIELDFKAFGDTVIATGQMVLRSEASSHRFSYTDVYVDEKLVSCQATLLG